MKYKSLDQYQLTAMAKRILPKEVKDVHVSRSEELIWRSENIDFPTVEGVIVTFTDLVTYKKRKMIFPTIQNFVNSFYKAVDALESELKLLKSQCLHNEN